MSTIWMRPSLLQRQEWIKAFAAVDEAVRGWDYIRSASGGINRDEALAALRPRLHALGFHCPDDSAVHLRAQATDGPGSVEVDAVHSQLGLALTVLGGRAHNNNEALTTALIFAAADNVEAGVLVVPHQYKGSNCAPNVRRRLAELASWQGVSLDLLAVHVTSF
jgi:hypothetical protein